MSESTGILDADAFVGCLLGQAVGDMMGLPMENLSPRRIGRLFPRLDRPRFAFGYGLASDDTEHACMTAQALLRSGGDAVRFRRSLAWRLRWWFAGVPAGIGKATALSCIRLWLGWPSARSGVNSAGNGPAMRAAILGVAGANLPNDRFREFVSASTALTHTDPKAHFGALVIAHAARCSSRDRSGTPIAPTRFLADCQYAILSDVRAAGLLGLIEAAVASVERNEPTPAFAASAISPRGVSGYINHTVPVAVHAWLRHPDDYRAAVEAVIRCGGDTDTVAAITGALVGARVGKAGIPPEWLTRYADRPRSAAWIERLGTRLADGAWRSEPQPAVRLAWWAVPVRNAVFLVLVLAHAFRRLLPPY